MVTIRATSGALSGHFVEAPDKVELVERVNLPDTVQVTGPLSAMEPIRTAGVTASAILGDGRVWTGIVTDIADSGITDGSQYRERSTVTLTSDLLWVWSRLCYPVPTQPWANQSAAAYDTRTGPAETLALAYTAANLRGAPLTVPASLGRGASRQVTARFDILGRLVADLLEPAALRITAVNGAISITAMPDLTSWATYGDAASGGALAMLSDWGVQVSRPASTAVLVAAGGELTARVTREAALTGTPWGRIESFLDQRQTTDVAEIDAAGQGALVDGASPVRVRASIPDVEGMRPGVEVPVGSLVAMSLAGRTVIDRIRTVTTTWEPAGVTRTATVGPESGELTRDQQAFLALARTVRKAASS